MLPQAEVRHIQSRLAKSQSFLDLAEFADGEAQMSDAIVSLCVTAAINASDAILVAHGLPVDGRRDHDRAPRDLRSIRQDGMATALSRLLKLKWKAQYSPEKCSASDAGMALAQARRALSIARDECERKMNP